MQQNAPASPAFPFGMEYEEYMDMDSGKKIRSHSKVMRHSPYALPRRTLQQSQTGSHSSKANSVQDFSGVLFPTLVPSSPELQVFQTEAVTSEHVETPVPSSQSALPKPGSGNVSLKSVVYVNSNNAESMAATEKEKSIQMDLCSEADSRRSKDQKEVRGLSDGGNEASSSEQEQLFEKENEFMYSSFNLMMPHNPVSPSVPAAQETSSQMTLYDLNSRTEVPSMRGSKHGKQCQEQVVASQTETVTSEPVEAYIPVPSSQSASSSPPNPGSGTVSGKIVVPVIPDSVDTQMDLCIGADSERSKDQGETPNNIASPAFPFGMEYEEYMDMDSGKKIRSFSKVMRLSPNPLPRRTLQQHETGSHSNRANTVQDFSGVSFPTLVPNSPSLQAFQTEVVMSGHVEALGPSSQNAPPSSLANTGSGTVSGKLVDPVTSDSVDTQIDLCSGSDSRKSSKDQEEVGGLIDSGNETGSSEQEQLLEKENEFMYSTFDPIVPHKPVSLVPDAQENSSQRTLYDLNTRAEVPAQPSSKHGNMRQNQVVPLNPQDVGCSSSNESGSEEAPAQIGNVGGHSNVLNDSDTDSGVVMEDLAEGNSTMSMEDPYAIDNVQSSSSTVPEVPLDGSEASHHLMEDVGMGEERNEPDVEDMDYGQDDIDVIPPAHDDSNDTLPSPAQPLSTHASTPKASAKKPAKKAKKATRRRRAGKGKASSAPKPRGVPQPRVRRLPRAKPTPEPEEEPLAPRKRRTVIQVETPQLHPPHQDRLANAPLVEDQDAQNKFSELTATTWKTKHSTAHPERVNSDICVYCKQDDSPHASKYEKDLKDLETTKIRCGHLNDSEEQCQVHFHVACIIESRPMTNYDPQYYASEGKFNKLVCHGHVCQICHTDRKMRSAINGPLVEVETQLRCFHGHCLPVGSTLNTDGTLKLFDYTKENKFEGDHSPACSVCGKHGARLVRCQKCVHSFHKSCNKWNEEDLCRRCTLDEQTEYGKPVLVQNGGFFRVGTCRPWDEVKDEITINTDANFGKEGFVAVRLENETKFVIKELWEVQRVPSFSAHNIFLTIKHSYYRMRGNVRDVELDVLRQTLKARDEEFDPTPDPVLDNFQVFHKSLFKRHAYSSAVKLMSEIDTSVTVHPDIEIDTFGSKGRGVKAKRDIPKKTVLVEYVGQVISKGEMMKRKALVNRSGDVQALHYLYETNMIVIKEAKKYEIAIDAAVHHNIAGFFNSSCEPNCVTMQEVRSTIADDVQFSKLIIETKDMIPEGTELTIDYKWLDLECLCGTPSCRKPMPTKEW